MARRSRSVHVCVCCAAEFGSSFDFNEHARKCPAMVLPEKGEAWDAYEARAAAFALAWRRANGKPDVVA
jgi:hypothetical protein